MRPAASFTLAHFFISINTTPNNSVARVREPAKEKVSPCINGKLGGRPKKPV
ncbi:MAG: hypothetical protein K1X52_11165 [Pyrinomonadaceae bacterium]|nr:hypothetical protein [Pyrinomonadaceae bacterium]